LSDSRSPFDRVRQRAFDEIIHDQTATDTGAEHDPEPDEVRPKPMADTERREQSTHEKYTVIQVNRVRGIADDPQPPPPFLLARRHGIHNQHRRGAERQYAGPGLRTEFVGSRFCE